MKPILLNFLNIIRRFKLAALLNILGLSVAFAAFMVIMTQLDYDWGFDQFHKDSNRIYRLEFTIQNTTQAVICRPLAELFFASSPHIVAGALCNPWGGEVFLYEEHEGVRNYYNEYAISVSPEFTDVFTFDFVEGAQETLKNPDQIIIPLSLAHKIFGKESAVGQQLVFRGGDMTVGAVYRDFPTNSVVNNYIYGSISENENKNNWGNWNYHTYIRVNHESNVPLLFDNFIRDFDSKAIWGDDFEWDVSGASLRLTALPDIHYVTDVQYDPTPKTSKPTLFILLAIAIVIVAIAAINFTNFSTALTPMRIKSINTQRVLGAQQSSIRLLLVSEAMISSLLSYLMAIFLILIFQRTPLAQLVDADLSLTAHPMIVGGTVLVAIFTGLLAGAWPARYITSFAPALVLKGSFGLSPKGRKLRNTLIGIQFIASFALFIGAFFMFLQNRFMQHSPLGYDKDELIVTNIGRIQDRRDAFTNQIKSYSGIEDVTYGEQLLSSSDQYMGWGRRYRDEQIQFQCLPVHYSFLKVLGIKISEGRDFREEDANSPYGVLIFNETAHKQYNLELNTTIDGSGEIIGFMPDVKFASFRTAVVPMAFYVWGTENWGSQPNQAYIKLKGGADVRATLSFIQATLTEFDADYTFNVRFYDQVLKRLYEKERSIGTLISLFSLIAIFISIVGVFGFVMFDSECRRKEIGIRKVHGAAISSIIIMFNKAYFRILIICFLVAAPLAWYAVYDWLQNFAYKTPMYWWVYLFAFLVIAVITACTVTFQNWRVATVNPVEAI